MKKTKIAALCVAAALVAAAAIAGTLAFFTDAKGTVNNQFTLAGGGDSKGVEIDLYENDVDYDEATQLWTATVSTTSEGVEYENIYPGAELPKNPKVENTGDYKAFVRMDVTVDEKLAEYYPAIVDINGDWATVSQTGNVYTYIWGTKAAPAELEIGEATDPIFTTVSIPSYLELEDMQDIDDSVLGVDAYAIQTAGAETSELVDALLALTKPE